MARRARRPRAPFPRPRAGSSTTCCRAGRCRRPTTSIAQSSLTVPMKVSSGSARHAVVAGLGDRSAGRQRRQPRAAPRAHLAVDPIAVQIGCDPAPPRRDALGRQLDDAVEVARASSRRTAPLGASTRRDRPRASCPPRTRRRSAARGCRVGDGADARHRAHRCARRRAAQCTRPARPASSGTAGPSACHRGCVRSDPRAAGTSRCCAATRSGTPSRSGRCRCRARAMRSPRARATHRRAAAIRRADADPSRGCRGAPPRRRRRAARPA